MKKTKKNYEEYLNQIYNEMGWIEAFNQLQYLSNPNRGCYCSQVKISNYNSKKQLGKLLRIFDPLAFEIGYSDWKSNT